MERSPWKDTLILSGKAREEEGQEQAEVVYSMDWRLAVEAAASCWGCGSRVWSALADNTSSGSAEAAAYAGGVTGCFASLLPLFSQGDDGNDPSLLIPRI